MLQQLRRIPGTAWGLALILGAFIGEWAGAWEKVAQWWQPANRVMAALFGADWLTQFVQSPLTQIAVALAALWLLWRSGNKATRREKEREQEAKREREAVLNITSKLMRYFWDRERLIGARRELNDALKLLSSLPGELETDRRGLPRKDPRRSAYFSHFQVKARQVVNALTRVGQIVQAEVIEPTLVNATWTVAPLENPPRTSPPQEMVLVTEEANEDFFRYAAADQEKIRHYAAHIEASVSLLEKNVGEQAEALKGHLR